MFLAKADDRTCKRLYDEHGRLVYSFLRARLRHDQDAEDCTVETFHRAFRHYGTYRKEGSERAWLLHIALNVARREFEKRAKRKEDPLDTLGTTRNWEPWSLTDTEEQATAKAMVEQLLETLPPERRSAVWLRAGLGFTDEEVAGILGAPVGTVKTWVWRSLATLRKSMVEAEPEVTA